MSTEKYMISYPYGFQSRCFSQLSQLQDVVACGQPSVYADIQTNLECLRHYFPLSVCLGYSYTDLSPENGVRRVNPVYSPQALSR